ncbi:transcriptional regulator [Sphingomonas sp.]|uniref:transcriptional regulator n=1 Tax=Sphingomonas sp. TaxID=28214 RepID=UPI003B3AA471
MLVFLDFEATSLGKQGVPIEVAWVFEDGREETYLIRPAPNWTDWDDRAQVIHGIGRATLASEGTAHDVVARRMVEALSGHQLHASAPSWDGKWLSALLRAAGLPRHALRLRNSDAAFADAARAALVGVIPLDRLEAIVSALVARTLAEMAPVRPAHRALADARLERDRWRAVRAAGAAFACANTDIVDTAD